MIPHRISAILLLAALAACSQSDEKAPEIVRPVLSVVVEPRTTQSFGFAGSIAPQFSADLAFRLLGRVVSRDVKVGDIVTKGTTIAALDPTALELALQAARAELSNAQAQFANAAASEERQRALLASANTSQAVFDAAQQARQSAAAGVERANAALAKSQEQLGYTRLFSDFDGVVTAVGAEVGQTVSPGQTVVTVARTDPREAVVDIPDQLTGDLAVGAPFEVVLQSLPSIRTEAKLREIAPQAEGTTRTRQWRSASARRSPRPVPPTSRRRSSCPTRRYSKRTARRRCGSSTPRPPASARERSRSPPGTAAPSPWNRGSTPACASSPPASTA